MKSQGALRFFQSFMSLAEGWPFMTSVESWVGQRYLPLEQPSYLHSNLPNLPPTGNALWYRQPAANTSTWSTEWLPIGNGYLGAMVAGGTRDDMIQVNIESLWSGGPFQNASYTGGNPTVIESSYISTELQKLRQEVFTSASGEVPDVAVLTYPGDFYGSFSGAGYLVSSRDVLASASSSYTRWLDLDSGLLKAQWSEGKTDYSREYFCSYPTKSCTSYTKSSSKSGDTSSYSFIPHPTLPNVKITCFDATTLLYTGQAEGPGMKYEFLARVQTKPANKARCSPPNDSSQAAIINVSGATESWITWVAGTNYNMDAGDAKHDFSFEGPDPHSGLVKDLAIATSKSYTQLRKLHLDDYKNGMYSKFSLDLGQEPDFSKSTDEQVEAYLADDGNVHLEWVLFNYGRYMLFTSGRGVLPSNLQGVWARDTGAPWSGDYHANINTQMNYWAAETTDIDVTASLWDYMLKTWVPRGEQTANILYGTKRGWATHNEMNIFGHTGMKAFAPWNSAQWANYPLAGAWMMVQVIDHLDYGLGSIKWWKSTGWPLLKGTAEFWLDNIFVDQRFDDGTMVVNPCNSPEQLPITLGCAHHQQIIWEVFNGIEKGFEYSGDSDVRFLADVRAKKARLDRGLHIGSWGQLQEWKIDKDVKTDTHRHLSHLYGLYPGYAIASYPEGGEVIGISRTELLNATRVSLEARGSGTGPDGDAGWEKVWRAACWAQLGEAELFYWQFKYAVERNFGYNLFSLYNPFSYDPIFQIDANLGAPAAVMNALLQAPDTASSSSPLIINVLPALPSAWSAKGHLKGARVRGGIGISFSWVNGKPKDIVLTFDRVVKKAGWTREVRVIVGGGSKAKEVDRFVGKAGLVRKVKN